MALLETVARVSEAVANYLSEMMQDDNDKSGNSIFNDTGDMEYDYLSLVVEVEKAWKNPPTFKEIQNAKDGKWWQTMENLLHQSDFRQFKIPIIPSEAIDESQDSLDAETTAQLDEIMKKINSE